MSSAGFRLPTSGHSARNPPRSHTRAGRTIQAVVPHAEIPSGTDIHDFGKAAILPGLVDSHVHINDPGRTEWEGFRDRDPRRRGRRLHLLVDMPLNCLPATTTVAALEDKDVQRRKASAGWIGRRGAAWSKAIMQDIEPLAAAGVPGFKCFLIHPGIDGFTMVDEDDLRTALASSGANRPAAAGACGTCRAGGCGHRATGQRRLENVTRPICNRGLTKPSCRRFE